MTRRMQILSGVIILLLGSYVLAHVGTTREASPSGPFAIARILFEQNATDRDAEVVIETIGGSEGLAKLTVVSPDGRTIVDFTAPGDSKLGIRQFRFESPEPKDVESLKSAYPEGAYIFTATTASGKQLESKATLSHKLPAPTSFLNPGINAEGVSAKNLEITWTPVKNVAAYMIYIEQEESGMNIEAKLSGSMAKFSVPDGFLLPGKEYTLGIGTVMRAGNASYVETSFTTAEND